ncbi:MAG: hypothetical protein GSR80_000392, partial [Desulfurococcales archaeon]|nr:hypothetical protein [Desulfurococcales archaeon]
MSSEAHPRCARWPPPRRSYSLEVAIPGSILSVEHGLLAKTLKAGLIARALAIYRVDEVIVYADSHTDPRDQRLLHLLLRYAEAPPHLKRRLFPLMEELRYAGLIPPLRTPHHEAPEEPVEGALLEGLVVSRRGGVCRVFLGRLGTWRIPGCTRPEGSRVTVEILDAASRLAREASWGGVYAGYRVSLAGPLEGLVGEARRRGRLVVGTSRLGDCPTPGVLCGILRGASRLGGLLV